MIPRAAATTFACLLAVFPAAAQSLPAFIPINPVAASRSGVYFQPYRPPASGKWTTSIALDYASTIEVNEREVARYTLDSEILRLRLGLGRDIGPRAFVLAGAEVGGAYAGFLDGFLNWYHHTLGFSIPERERGPDDRFLYQITLPDGTTRIRAPSDLFLGDLRFGVGYRFGRSLQTVVSATLPTSTAPDGYGRGVVSLSLLNTVRVQPTRRLVLEGGLGFGYAASHGDLEGVQRETFASASGGGRYRFWGRQSLFATVFYHSPYYRNTTLPSLDRRELSLDFGWLLATRGGAGWRIGLTEDLEPGGPAIDLIFRLGRDF
ncbi:MAG: DUF3187 family protein [Gemmatimonadales bacterium]